MTLSPALKKLDDFQLADFDKDYVSSERLENVARSITAHFDDTPFSILDVGGGNGRFLDTLLERYPKARGTLLDNAQVLIDLNRPHPRKRLICDSVENIDSHLRSCQFDLICFNFVLHHFVTHSYTATRTYQVDVLSHMRGFLSAHGRITILEDIYTGALFSGLPSRLIFAVTSSKLLRPLARRLGANTAGVGVCFLNRSQWQETFQRARLEVLEYHPYCPNQVTLVRRVGCHVGSMRASHFWLRSELPG